MVDAVIEAQGLHKAYGPIAAVNGLDLRVSAGSICGFLGRNGAGKTTTMKVLMGMVHADCGAARVFGLDPENVAGGVAIRARAAFVSDDKHLYDSMTVGEIIRFTAAFFPGWQRDLEAHYLRTFGLRPAQPVEALSRGMRTKLALLLALCRGAELLILDEPTSGLDPAAAEEVLQALVAQVARGDTTIFFSSHQIAEVEQVADEIAIIDAGRLIVAGAMDTVRDTYRRVQLVFTGDAPDHVFAAPGVTRVSRSGRVLTLVASGDLERIEAEARGLMPDSIDVTPLSLKDIFLESVIAEAQ